MTFRTVLPFLLVLTACGERGDEGATRAAVQAAPAAGPGLLALEVTTLTPGGDTALAQLSNPYEGDDQAIAEGRLFFNQFNCSGCHAALGGGGMGPPLSDTLWIYGGEPGRVYLSILQGRPNGMPSWHQLPPEVIWKLVAYIHTLPEQAALVSTRPQP